MSDLELATKLGMDPGATLSALVALARRVLPEAPGDAFGPLWLCLPWLDTEADGWAATPAPRNVHLFAATLGASYFGFLLGHELPTDERPIVRVEPTDDDEATDIVAPNLRAFLGLLTVAFGEVIYRDATDAEWAGSRRAWYGDDPARISEMERLSTLLRTIPGVSTPSSPSAVTNALPRQRFELPDSEPPAAPWAEACGLVRRSRDRLLSLADGMLDGAMLSGAALASAKQTATAQLLSAMRALVAADRAAASALVAGWRDEARLWKTLQRGASEDLGALIDIVERR